MLRWNYRVINRRQAVLLLGLLFAAAVLLVLVVSAVPAVFTSYIIDSDNPSPICCTDRADHVICLTFDAARGNKSIDAIDELLKQYHIKATFFVTGEWAERCPDSMQRLLESGQEIMSASDHSAGLTSLLEDETINLINAGNDKIQAITGKRPVLFRSPDGKYDDNLLEALAMLEMMPIRWDVDSFDYTGLDEEGIIKRVVSQSASGSIIRFNADGKNTLDALPQSIEKLKEKGFRFIPVSEMVYQKNYSINRQGRQISKN